MFKPFYYLIKLKPSNAARWNQNENILLYYVFVIIELPVYNDFYYVCKPWWLQAIKIKSTYE